MTKKHAQRAEGKLPTKRQLLALLTRQRNDIVRTVLFANKPPDEALELTARANRAKLGTLQWFEKPRPVDTDPMQVLRGQEDDPYEDEHGDAPAQVSAR